MMRYRQTDRVDVPNINLWTRVSWRRGIAALVCCAGIASTLAVEAQERIEARVSKITDGDTFTLSGTSRRLRVWGLDAPERDEPGGAAATEALRSLIAGQTLICDVRDLDRYDRIVGQCFLPDGRDITFEMIRAGVATEYCRYSRGYYGTC